ncbi:MAG: hypothetical protein OEL89_04660, partial [Candidatus Peregrinibacteria bacterium]|nr:hypothetical protein [Candidatus Peregrinibacteria bacterium]
DWDTVGIDATDYFQITVTPDSGYDLNITDIDFAEQRSATGPPDVSVQWSKDPAFGVSTSILTINGENDATEHVRNISGLNIDVADGETLYVRFFGYNASGGGGTFWVRSSTTLTVSGSVADSEAPQSPSISNASGDPTNDQTPTLNISATDNVGVSQMALSCNGSAFSAWEAYATTKTDFDVKSGSNGCSTSDGAKTVYIKFRDAALNESANANTGSFTVDTTAPTIAETGPVTDPTNDNTPNYTFSSDEVGTIGYAGDCSSVTTAGVSGSNTVTFNTLSDATHNNCQVTVTDSAGNVSNTVNVTSFTVDTSAPVIAEVTPVTTPGTDSTPAYTFSSTQTGTISYAGDCSSATGSASVGNNTITFDALTDGTHNNCTITVTDAATNASNVLSVSSFYIDTTAPVIAEVSPISTPTNSNTPSYTFSSDEAGTIGYAGDCSSATTVATVGDNIITFNSLSDGTHSNCQITVTDSLSNVSNTINVTAFAVDTIAPIIAEVTPVPNPTNDNTPDYVFSTDEAGTITYGGGCASLTTAATAGNNTVTFNTLADGTYGSCTVTVTDSANNVSNIVTITSFEVDTLPPSLSPVSIVSNNANTSLAKVGDTVTISFTASDPITNVVGTIFGRAATTTTNVGGNDWIISTTALVTDPEGAITFTIDFDEVSPPNNGATVSTTTDASSVIFDRTAPTLAEVTPVTTPTADNTPDYTFSSDEVGTITYGGTCSSGTTSALASNNTVTFGTLADGTHGACSVEVTDAAGNVSNTVNVSSFFVDTTAPSGTVAISGLTDNITNDTTHDYTLTATDGTGVGGLEMRFSCNNSSFSAWETFA